MDTVQFQEDCVWLDWRIRESVSDLPIQVVYAGDAVRDQIKHHRIWCVGVCHASQEMGQYQEAAV